MKNLIAGLTVSAALATSAFAGPADELTMHMERVAVPHEAFAKIAQLPTGPFDCFTNPSADCDKDLNPEDSPVSLDSVINMAQKIWDIIKANEPVLNVKYDYANALPRGVHSSEELDGFSSVQSEGIRLWATNGFGATVYDFTLTAIHQYGGSYEGKGKYLETVSVVPTTVNVSWGYTVDVTVARISVVNVGTREAPVGSVTMDTTFSVSTVLQKHQKRIIYTFRGDSPKVQTVGF